VPSGDAAEWLDPPTCAYRTVLRPVQKVSALWFPLPHIWTNCANGKCMQQFFSIRQQSYILLDKNILGRIQTIAHHALYPEPDESSHIFISFLFGIHLNITFPFMCTLGTVLVTEISYAFLIPSICSKMFRPYNQFLDARNMSGFCVSTALCR
jgi:hypothetical protein